MSHGPGHLLKTERGCFKEHCSLGDEVNAVISLFIKYYADGIEADSPILYITLAEINQSASFSVSSGPTGESLCDLLQMKMLPEKKNQSRHK